MDNDKKQKAYQLLFEAVCHGTADDVIRQANRLFGLPVLLVDEFFHVAAMHPAASFGSAQWDEIRENKAMDREKAWKALDLSGGEFYQPFFQEEDGKLFGQLVKDDVVVGHVIVFFFGDKPNDGDFQLMSMVLDSLRVITESRETSRWSMSLSAKLQDLLDPNTPPRVKKLAVEGVAASLEPEYAIIAAPVGELPSHKAFGRYAVYQLKQTYREVVSLVFDGRVITLVGGLRRERENGSKKPPSGGIIGRLLEFFEAHNMICGVSNCFSDPAKAYIHYRQALLTANLAVSSGLDRSAVFMDVMPLPIFSRLKETDEPETFVHPAIYDMIDYDEKNGTAYYETMKAYSLTMRDKDKTAAKLSIHRNTLLYRLGRIAELFSLPYEDEDVALNLLCGFLLLY